MMQNNTFNNKSAQRLMFRRIICPGLLSTDSTRLAEPQERPSL